MTAASRLPSFSGSPETVGMGSPSWTDANEAVVPRVLALRQILARRLEQQDVAGAHDNVADLPADLLAVAGDGDDDGVVPRAELAGADRSSDERVRVAHHGLDQYAARPWLVELHDLVRCRLKPADLLKIDDRCDIAHEHEPVVGLQDLIGPDRRKDRAAALDLGEIQARQVPEPRLLDRLARQRPAGGDGHLDGVRASIARGRQHRRAFGQQPLADREHVEQPDARDRHADERDREQPERVVAGRGPLAVNDKVGARADERARAAEDGGVAERDHEG